MSENSDKDNKSQVISKGVSGTKELRVRRVHKKKTSESSAAPAAEPVKAAEVAAPAVTAEVAPAEQKEAAKATKTTKTAKTTKTTKASEEQAPVKESKEEEVKPAAKKKTTKKAAESEEPAEEKKPKATKTSKAKTQAKAEEETSKPEPAPEQEPKKEQTPAAEAEPAPEAPAKENKEPAIDRTKISSAVVAMPETVRTSTVIPERRYGNRAGGYQGNNYRGGAQGRGPRPQGQGGGFRAGGPGRGPAGGFAKDKDEEGSNAHPAARRPSKPKSDAPMEDIKKSRTSYAEKSAFDKKHDDRDRERQNGNGDRRLKNRGGQFNGRMSSGDDEYDDYSYGRKKKKKNSYEETSVVEQTITDIQIPPFITVKEFAEGIGKKSSDVIKELMVKLGVMATINQELDFDTACLLADGFGINATLLEEKTEEDILFDDDDEKITENMETRPPVVVVMGHVDHGKTSLLDKIRASSVAAGEAGGITQKIGAYTVRVKGRQITFLDTPGHEAFTTMRARGAQVTDIAILVVAADDGVMPQTIEAINHAKAANTEIVVAINKIDKPGANPDKVKQELSNYELIPEEWGGSTIMVPVSAKQGIGIDELLENVLLVADVKELKADPKRQMKGTVIEAQLDKSRGPVATILVQRGTLKQGDAVVCGAMIGNIRAMYDDKGEPIKKAGPSIPVEILGLPEVPDAGESIYAVKDEKMARQLVEKRKIKQREEHIRKSSRMSLETLAAQMAEGNIKDLNIIVKADIQGSVEAVTQSFEKLSNDEVRVKVIHGAVGAINESDIVLADVSNAVIIGFNVRPNAIITEKAKEAGVEIKLYDVIYKATEDIEKAMKGMLEPTFEEVVLGHAEIRELFKVSGVGTIGGCYVTDGKIIRNCGVRILRNDIVIHTGELASLQRLKDSVKEVVSGFECGLSVANYNDIKVGDVVEAFTSQEVERDA
ncbi:MAG: translation initiation factor IF-2 [Saccharofermentans sp.]|nr:translation initiation factor IF-2 [Saccharofermentans sp.]